MPEPGSVWEIRYRILGRSKVWPDMFVCELLTGPDKGEVHIIEESRFEGKPTGTGEYNNGLQLAEENHMTRIKVGSQ